MNMRVMYYTIEKVIEILRGIEILRQAREAKSSSMKGEGCILVEDPGSSRYVKKSLV